MDPMRRGVVPAGRRCVGGARCWREVAVIRWAVCGVVVGVGHTLISVVHEDVDDEVDC